MINSKLTQEIINHIFLTLEIKPKSNSGLFSSSLKLSKTIDIEYEKDIGIIAHPVFGGITQLNNVDLRVLVSNLSVDDEFLAVLAIKADTYSTYLLRWNSLDTTANTFNLKNNKKIESASINIQANCLIGIENLINFGKIWNPIREYDDLFTDLLTLCE